MKNKFLLISILLYTLHFTLYADVPPGFEVYFNNPTGTQDTNIPGLDFRFKNFVDLASDTTIYAAFYDIDNSTVIAALNSALNRGCDVYIVINSTGAGSPAVLSQILTPHKKFRNEKASPAGLMHNKFCVIKDSSVWTGSWNATYNCTCRNNNNAIVLRSAAVAKIYENEFLEMYNNNRYGSAKTLPTDHWNGKTEYVNGVKVKIYFSPYSNPRRTSDAIRNEIKGITTGTDQFTGAEDSIYIAMYASNDDNIGDDVIKKFQSEVKTLGIFDAGQAESSGSNSLFFKFKDVNIPVVLDGNPDKLHHKFGIIDVGCAKARVITGSHNWTTKASGDNDENTLIIYSTGIAKMYYEEFQKLYLQAGPAATPSKKSVADVVVYPSPARNKTTIGFEISSNVTAVTVKIYTLSGELVWECNPIITPGVYNEVPWDCVNDDDEKVASGLYILKIEATTADKTFFATEKFAVIKGGK